MHYFLPFTPTSLSLSLALSLVAFSLAISIPDSYSAEEACRIALPFDLAVSKRILQLASSFHPRPELDFSHEARPDTIARRSSTPPRRKIAFTVKTRSCASHGFEMPKKVKEEREREDEVSFRRKSERNRTNQLGKYVFLYRQKRKCAVILLGGKGKRDTLARANDTNATKGYLFCSLLIGVERYFFFPECLECLEEIGRAHV